MLTNTLALSRLHGMLIPWHAPAPAADGNARGSIQACKAASRHGSHARRLLAPPPADSHRSGSRPLRWEGRARTAAPRATYEARGRGRQVPKAADYVDAEGVYRFDCLPWPLAEAGTQREVANSGGRGVGAWAIEDADDEELSILWAYDLIGGAVPQNERNALLCEAAKTWVYRMATEGGCAARAAAARACTRQRCACRRREGSCGMPAMPPIASLRPDLSAAWRSGAGRTMCLALCIKPRRLLALDDCL